MPRRYPLSVPVAQPAAGAGAVYTVGGQWVERIVAVSFQLVTSAAVANREPAVQLRDPDANPVYVGASGQVQVASVTTTWGAGPVGGGSPSGAGTRFQTLPLAVVELYPGWQLAIVVASIDVADQLSAIRLMIDRRANVEEIFEPGLPAGDYLVKGRQ